MKRALMMAAVIIAVGFTAVAAAQPAPSVDEILDLSGVRAQLVGLTSDLPAHLGLQPGELAPADEAAMLRIVQRGFAPDVLYPVVRERFARHADEARMRDVAAWLRSPLGMRITRMETDVATGAARQQAGEYAARLRHHPPPQRRLVLIQRLDAVGHGTDMSIDVVVTMTRSMGMAIERARHGSRPGDLAEMERQLALARTQMRPMLHEASLVLYLFTYRALSDAELERYITFLGSDAGQWFIGASRSAMLHAIGVAADATTTEIVRAVPLERWKGGPPTR